MTKKARNTLAIAAATIGLMSLAGLAAAQTPWWDGGGWYGGRTPVQYRLTQEQARRADEIRAKYEGQLVPIEKELASRRVELDAALARDDAEPGRVIALRRQVRGLEDQIEDLQMEANAAAGKLLTPDQRAYSGDAYDLFHGGAGWSCPMMHRGPGRTMAEHWQGMGWHGDGGRDMSWGRCW